MRIIFILFFLIAVFCDDLTAQWPKSNVYVFNIQRVSGEYQLTNARFLTAINSDGYNNQPHFANNLLYITAAYPDSPHTDIWELDVIRGIRSRVTQTSVSEFSPKISADGNFIYAVVIEEDGKTQRLWRYPVNRRGSAQRALLQPEDAGYYEWLGKNRIVIFRANETLTTEIAETSPAYRVLHTFNTKVGRCFRYLDHNRLVLVQEMRGQNYLGIFHINTLHWEPLIGMPGTSVDFAVSSGGDYWVGSGSELYKFNPHRDNSWIKIADLSPFGITNITRLDISVSGMIAVVDQP